MCTRFHNERGVSLTELLLAISIALTVAGLSVGGIMAMVKTSRADGGLAEAVAAIEWAREMSVSQRRNMQVVFVEPNQIQIFRVGVNGTAETTPLRVMVLEGRVRFVKMTGIPDTPLAFGNSASNGINFGSSTPVMFTTDGSLLNAGGDVINGTLFLGVVGDLVSPRALTVFGATGALTPWVWDGRKWNER
jgi:Tfp pilus assembly protein FimT